MKFLKRNKKQNEICERKKLKEKERGFKKKEESKRTLN